MHHIVQALCSWYLVISDLSCVWVYSNVTLEKSLLTRCHKNTAMFIWYVCTRKRTFVDIMETLILETGWAHRYIINNRSTTNCNILKFRVRFAADTEKIALCQLTFLDILLPLIYTMSYDSYTNSENRWLFIFCNFIVYGYKIKHLSII